MLGFMLVGPHNTYPEHGHAAHEGYHVVGGEGWFGGGAGAAAKGGWGGDGAAAPPAPCHGDRGPSGAGVLGKLRGHLRGVLLPVNR